MTNARSWRTRTLARTKRDDSQPSAPKSGPRKSWWCDYAQPNQRDHFIEAAAVRTRQRIHDQDMKDAKKQQFLSIKSKQHL